MLAPIILYVSQMSCLQLQVQSHASVTLLLDFVWKPEVPFSQLTLATWQTFRHLFMTQLPMPLLYHKESGAPLSLGLADPYMFTIQLCDCAVWLYSLFFSRPETSRGQGWGLTLSIYLYLSHGLAHRRHLAKVLWGHEHWTWNHTHWGLCPDCYDASKGNLLHVLGLICNLENGACEMVPYNPAVMNTRAKGCEVLHCFCIPLRIQVLRKILPHALSPSLTSHCTLLSLLACFQLLLLRVQPFHLAVKAQSPGIFLLSLLINAGAASFNGLSVSSKNVDCTIKWKKYLAISSNSCETRETFMSWKTETPESIYYPRSQPTAVKIWHCSCALSIFF